MNLCSDDHTEIAFEGRACPFCAYLKDTQQAIDGLKVAVSTLKADLDNAEKEASALKQQLDDLLKPCLEAANGVSHEQTKV